MKCPICGTTMRQTGRGATLRKHGPRYICPVDEADTTKDANGHLRRNPQSKHVPSLRSWRQDELDEQYR